MKYRIYKIYYRDGTIFEGEWNNVPHLQDFSKIIHREDGPAMELPDGWRRWFFNGQLHREDGPAAEWPDGSTEWYLNGKRHREDGPAIEEVDGTEEWWLYGKRLKTLSQKYLIKYMELTGETLTTLLIHPDKMIQDSVRKYKWSN